MTAMPPGPHIPVLVDAVLAALAPRDDAVYVDATFGAGGYSEAILGAARCRVFGIDRDPDAVARGRALAEKHGGRLTLIAGPFGDMERLIGPFSPGPIAGIAFDLGVSSMQLDEAGRGFSFRQDGPLDMRMSQEGESAADLIARLSERELSALIRALGEERFAGRVARAVAAAQHRRPLATTGELADIVRAAIPRREPGIDSATRTFQALRIAVNDELGNLKRGLETATQFLKSGGRIAVISFHSLEDRIVKQFFVEKSTGCTCPTDLPACACGRKEVLRIVTRKPVTASEAEVHDNPRARSAKLRVAEKI
jgi:16S rRNA (cytosine1402-N4)-methyltransferase